MNTKLKIIGIVNIGLGLLLFFIYGSVGELKAELIVQAPITMFLPGLLIIGGIGLIVKWKPSWFINQLTSVYVLVSTIAALSVSLPDKKEVILGYEESVTKSGQLISFLFGLCILIISISLIITNKDSVINEFKVNRLRQLTTLGIVTIFSLAITLRTLNL